MSKQKLMTVSMVILMLLSITAGCGNLRFGPGETQKQNAYLHHRTVQSAALRARGEQSSDVLQKLTSQAAKQSDAIVAYYGLPKELPASENVEEILSAQNAALTENARLEAGQRPDPWDVADHLLELGIALAGIVGGAFSGRMVGTLRVARRKSDALREIIRGNQLFKTENPKFTDAFKKAHQLQSEQTKHLVAMLK